jgi:hypothetical protein
MPKFLQSSLSLGAGVLVYEALSFWLNWHSRFRWGRIAFMVFFSMPIFWLVYKLKARQVMTNA